MSIQLTFSPFVYPTGCLNQLNKVYTLQLVAISLNYTLPSPLSMQ